MMDKNKLNQEKSLVPIVAGTLLGLIFGLIIGHTVGIF